MAIPLPLKKPSDDQQKREIRKGEQFFPDESGKALCGRQDSKDVV